MTKRSYIAVGQNYWQKAGTAERALVALKRRLRGGGLTPAQYRVGIYQCHPSTCIDGMGHFRFELGGGEPKLVRLVEVAKATGRVRDLPVSEAA